MKPQLNHFFLALALTGGAAAQTPTNFTDGASFGTSGANGNVLPWSWSTEKSLQVSAYDGSLLLYSSQEGLTRGGFDGGVVTYGNPVDIVLGSDESSQIDRGVFRVWGSSDYLYGNSSVTPLFSIAHPAGTATFDGVDVVISNGTLTVAGSPALTQANSTSYLSGQGFLQSSGLSAALSGITPPTDSSWTNTYLARGAVTNNGILAFGTLAAASAQYAVAIGHGAVANGTSAFSVGTTTTASGINSFSGGSMCMSSGNYSFSYGNTAGASGIYSTAMGAFVNAEGLGSYAHGLRLNAKSASETVFGRWAKESTPTSVTIWHGHDGLFRIGNGFSTYDYSDAVTVLKSGETTLSNKAWRKAVALDPAVKFDDPAATDDSNGKALIVEGHTHLKGKVLMEPQGDLTMGGFTGGETP